MKENKIHKSPEMRVRVGGDIKLSSKKLKSLLIFNQSICWDSIPNLISLGRVPTLVSPIQIL